MLTPERPFVPDSSASRPARQGTPTPFRVIAPFVHGMNPTNNENAQRVQSDRDLLTDSGTFESTAHEEIPPIAAFLETRPMERERVNAEARFPESSFDFDSASASDELPPVEHFTDPLPGIEDFRAAETYERALSDFGHTSGVVESGYDAQVEIPVDVVSDLQRGSGWVETDWQQFDWTGAAALGEANDPAASSAWSQTDWDPPQAEPKETAAQAIAKALDQIAQRIRNGELLVPPSDIVNDSAAIAATLAAMLGVRR